jgi:phosphoglycerate kinase
MQGHFQTIDKMDVANKTVLVRADLNVPVDGKNVTDFTRIDRLKPTIDYLKDQNAKIVILSHFGRPKGARNEDYSLSFLSSILQERWGIDVSFASDCIGDEAKSAIADLSQGACLLLENVRFHHGEDANDAAFAQSLAALGDVFINDAFSAAHRAHASTTGITAYLPSAAGLLMERELNALQAALEKPKQPVMAIVGGAKISTKLSVLNNLIQKVDYLALGGGMANTFLHAKGYDVGGSLCEKDMKDEALNILKAADKAGCLILLPEDLICVQKLEPNAEKITIHCHENNVPSSYMAVDAGRQTIELLTRTMHDCETLLWNGPMGVFEVKPFDRATNELAKFAASRTKNKHLISVAGGGDTVAALENAGVINDFTYISTAGGAFLEWLEGKPLPGVQALMNP